MNQNKNKHSLMIGILTSSFGIFVSKALGLLYYSPLSSFAGEANMAFYSIAYTYYDLLLKISSAGIPFAIAALVSRYYAKEDYKTILLIKKLGISIIMCLTFMVAIIFGLCSPLLARQSMGAFASAQDIENLKIIFSILLLAVILVPYLSALRGYYQGLKRLDLYGSSQALEQFVRVFCIIFFGFLLVRVFKLNSIYAIYAAIAAASIAAFITIIFFLLFTRADDKSIEILAKKQVSKEMTHKTIIIELISLSIPYLLISFLGSLSALVNSTFFMDTATKAGLELNQAKLEMGILLANCNKLSSIPQVLTLGFSAGLVPYLSESYEKQDLKTLNNQIIILLETALFILIPALFVFFFFAKDIYFIMYGNSNLNIGTELFRFYTLVTFTDTLAPILSSIMITLRLKKEAITTLLISFVLKLSTFFILVRLMGSNGMTLSTAISSSFVIIMYIYILNKKFKTKFVTSLKKVILIMLSSFIMVIPALFIHIQFNLTYTSRIIDILIMILCGVAMIIIYYFVTVCFKLPQTIFNLESVHFKDLLKKLKLR